MKVNLTKMNRILIVDVDGTLAKPYFIYSSEGKKYKFFGPDDSGFLKSLNGIIDILIISADSRGMSISKSRVNDIGIDFKLVKSINRASFINSLLVKYDQVFYIGDSFFDIPTAKLAMVISFAPADADSDLLSVVTHRLKRFGGDRAVSEAIKIICKNYLKIDYLKFIEV